MEFLIALTGLDVLLPHEPFVPVGRVFKDPLAALQALPLSKAHMASFTGLSTRNALK